MQVLFEAAENIYCGPMMFIAYQKVAGNCFWDGADNIHVAWRMERSRQMIWQQLDFA